MSDISLMNLPVNRLQGFPVYHSAVFADVFSSMQLFCLFIQRAHAYGKTILLFSSYVQLYAGLCILGMTWGNPVVVCEWDTVIGVKYALKMHDTFTLTQSLTV